MQGRGILPDLYRSINDVEVTTFAESIDVLNGAEITWVGQVSPLSTDICRHERGFGSAGM